MRTVYSKRMDSSSLEFAARWLARSSDCTVEISARGEVLCFQHMLHDHDKHTIHPSTDRRCQQRSRVTMDCYTTDISLSKRLLADSLLPALGSNFTG